MGLNKKYCIGTIVLISSVAIVYWIGIPLYYEIGGSIVVNDPNFIIKEYADCNYGMDALLEEKVICKNIKNGIIFKSHASDNSLYRYRFYIEGEGMKIYPEIRVSHNYFKHDRYSFVIELSPNSDGGYSATVRGKKDGKGCAYYRCNDVEKDGISFQIGP